MWTARVLVAAVLVVCAASSADARRRHHGYYGGYGERYSTRGTLDEWRARQAQGQNREPSRDNPRGQARGDETRDPARGDDHGPEGAQDRAQEGLARSAVRSPARRDEWRRARYEEWRPARYDDRRRWRDREDLARARAAESGDLVLGRGRSGPFGAAIEKLARGCAAQAAEFDNWPFEAISRAVSPDNNQREALEGLRDAVKQATQRLTTDCPQDVPAAPAARLEAAELGIAATLAAYDTVEPKLQAFYGALNDEQKARLYRGVAAPAATNATETSGRREAQEDRRERRDYYSRRHRWRAYAATREAAAREVPGWSRTCEELAAVLHNWPVREIERDVRLSGAQRVAFYELVTASLKAADTLGSACPAEAALTPVGRLETMRKRLTAVRAATAAIRPALARFYEALDQGQKVRFAGMS
jgi:hypothetical protein